MKTHILPLSVLGLLAGIMLSSCASMNTLTMNVTEPAPVYFPSGIKKVGIINRSGASAENAKADEADKILSIEGKHLDSLGARQSALGLHDELAGSGRFDEVKMIEGHGLTSPGMGIFPVALSWDVVEDLCRKYGVEAIFVLSFYDTDTRIDYQTNPVEMKLPMGLTTTVLEHTATVRTMIKTGWRIYDPANRIIRDEFILNREVVSTGTGINPMKAVEAIIGRKDAVMQVSNDLGHDYGLRIFPFRVRVSREYYIRGTANFAIGKRKARAGDWQGAATNWQQELGNPKRKIAGRACYNMAIINEIDGNLDDAITWATKSYTEYNNKRALDYLNILKYRKQQQNLLQQP